MQYMLLIYEDDADRVAMMDERMPVCAAYVETMIKAGIYVSGDRLRGVDTATSFHVIDVPDLDSALAWAARCPSAARGVVEVRPIWPR
jgi:hypothetical protein